MKMVFTLILLIGCSKEKPVEVVAADEKKAPVVEDAEGLQGKDLTNDHVANANESTIRKNKLNQDDSNLFNNVDEQLNNSILEDDGFELSNNQKGKNTKNHENFSAHEFEKKEEAKINEHAVEDALKNFAEFKAHFAGLSAGHPEGVYGVQKIACPIYNSSTSKSDVVGYLDPGDEVHVIDKPVDGWLKIGKKKYIQSAFVHSYHMKTGGAEPYLIKDIALPPVAIPQVPVVHKPKPDLIKIEEEPSENESESGLDEDNFDNFENDGDNFNNNPKNNNLNNNPNDALNNNPNNTNLKNINNSNPDNNSFN